ncbi:LrgB family protein [Pseudomonas typographi]|uniref:LrgB family protein n=1 Tax=Pseudomonas typographi TaxID=2715964 RepID=A0ABR7Z5F4_9PSED|nr:LrgB family protein [Pseudomonas typographi]MBD1554088.1 LrgB family protein [Pseudomonas typographi]MBD1600705.1 LrgB family protein [Pseudomonas typographi]
MVLFEHWEAWGYLKNTSALGLALTLVAYLIAQQIHTRLRRNPLANPVLISVALLLCFLEATQISYTAYLQSVQSISILLGMVTVALALPVYRQLSRLGHLTVPLLGGLVAGSLTALFSVTMIAKLLGASPLMVLSLVPKSATAPIAMEVSAKIGGLPTLTAIFTISAGILGAVCSSTVFRLLKIKEPEIQGFSLGIASHGIGAARAFQLSEEAGAFAGMGMSLNGIFTAFVVPILLPYASAWLLY